MFSRIEWSLGYEPRGCLFSGKQIFIWSTFCADNSWLIWLKVNYNPHPLPDKQQSPEVNWSEEECLATISSELEKRSSFVQVVGLCGWLHAFHHSGLYETFGLYSFRDEIFVALFTVELFLSKYPELHSPNLPWIKSMRSVGRIFNPNKRSPVQLSILYHT